jgi:hypothetical protein
MKTKVFACIAVVLLAGAFFHAAVAEADTSGIRVKKAIADTMTPEELQAYKERLAVNFANLPQPSQLDFPETPGDICSAATYEIAALPFGPVADTTVGAVDNYDLPPDVVDPTCTAAVTCTGAGPAGSLPRGAVYTGTGTGPDRAFRIRTDANCTLSIAMTPTSGQDLALITYLANCSSSLADCACVSDTGIGGGTETISLSAVAGTDYFVVIDGYSTGGTPPGPSGPYTLTITGSGCSLVPVTLQGFEVD